MNFLSMEYFSTVAREKSFSKAAEQLHITQQTLSAHIKGIEKELDCMLFIRKIPLELTYAGQVFLRYANIFNDNYKSMKQEFQDISKEQTGVLKVGVAFTRGYTLMPILIENFQKSYPHFEIRLIEESNNALNKSLLEGKIDIAIANYPDLIPEVKVYPFYEEEIVLLISKSLLRNLYSNDFDIINKVQSIGDLSILHKCPFVMSSPDDIAGKIGRQYLHQANINPPIKAQSDNLETLLSLCINGVGACFSPRNLAMKILTCEQMAKLIVIPLPNQSHYQISFGVLKKNYQWNIITEFIKGSIDLYNLNH